MDLWAVEYEYLGDKRYMLVETDGDWGYSDVVDTLHPAIKAKNPTVTFVGEVVSV